MNEWLKGNISVIFTLIGVIFAGGIFYNTVQTITQGEVKLDSDVGYVKSDISRLDSDVKVLDIRTTNHDREIDQLQQKVYK